MCKSVSSSSVHGTDMSLHRRLDEQTVLVTAVIVVVNVFIPTSISSLHNNKPVFYFFYQNDTYLHLERIPHNVMELFIP